MVVAEFALEHAGSRGNEELHVWLFESDQERLAEPWPGEVVQLSVKVSG